MASQDARLSKFEADFKQQHSEMTNKIDTLLKAITNRIAGALPSDTVKNPKLNVNSTSPVLSAQPEQTLEDEFKDLHLNLPILKVLAHALIYNAILYKYVESLELGKNGSAFIQGEMPKKIEDPRLFTLPYGTKSYPIGIVRDVEVHIRRLKLLTDFYVIDMKKDPETPLLVRSEFLATANAVIDYRKAKIAVGEGITRSVFRVKGIELGEWEIARDAKINPFKDVLVFRRMVKFLGAIPINLKRNMWESEDLIKSPINWDKPPKNRDGAWHAKIRLIDPDGEEFTKTP
ncbi:MAK10-like protein [Tanacetum coccineum]